jgi:hypothetical protein
MIDRRQLWLETPAPAGASSPTWHSAAWLTVPDERRRDELQILVHGANYDHRYWDWPVDSPANFEYGFVPETGHNLNLHYTAHEGYEMVERWLDAAKGVLQAARPVSNR